MFSRGQMSGMVAGMMGTAGGIGAAAFSQAAGTTIRDHGFTFAFVLAASLIPAAGTMLVLLLRPSEGPPRRRRSLHEFHITVDAFVQEETNE